MSVSLNSFHNAKPMHMHPACENCRQPSRLLRCGKCHIARYCSKECQSRDWRIHKRDCKDWQHLCDDSKSASGNPSAWLDFAKWMEYHDDSILNAALAYFISKGPGSEDNYALCLFLIYDSEAPLVERKFQVHDAQFIHKDLPDTPYIPQAVIKAALEPHDPTPHNLWQSRLGLITTGPVRKGTCIFVPSWSATGGSGLFYRSFNMTEKQLSADVNAYMHPRRMLMKMFELGQKYRICCGDIRETSTCCCGGWTHEDDAVELFPFKSLNDVKGESLEKLGHFEAAATPSHEELLIGQEEQQEAPQSPKEVKSKKKKPKSKKKKHGDKVIDSDPRSSELDPRARDSEDNVEHSLQTPREAQSTASAIDAETGQNSDASDRRTTAAAASAASEEPEVIDSERCSHVTMNADSGVVTGVTSDAQDCTQYGAQLGTLQESSPTWSRHGTSRSLAGK
ncbi:hypothetical protein PENSPDRAFT_355083 [Peniophora sp. CONT]|nr:hypothetical protein PENSPDRAFT_355083 [Peniophora sp. CONT]